MLLLLASGVAIGRPAPGQPSETGDGAVLAGPVVEPEARASSLVRLGYDGRVERLSDVQPEVAALDLIELDDAARSRIGGLLEARAAFMDGAVMEHYRLLLDLYSAFAAGDEGEVVVLYLRFTSHLAPLFERGGLAAQLGAEMPPEQAGRYRTLVREYYLAVGRDEVRGSVGAERPAGGLAVAIRNHRIEHLMQEVGRSFERVIRQKSEELEQTLEAMALGPQREAEIRALVDELGSEFGLNPTEAQKREIFVRIYEALDPQERGRFLGWVLR